MYSCQSRACTSCVRSGSGASTCIPPSSYRPSYSEPEGCQPELDDTFRWITSPVMVPGAAARAASRRMGCVTVTVRAFGAQAVHGDTPDGAAIRAGTRVPHRTGARAARWATGIPAHFLSLPAAGFPPAGLLLGLPACPDPPRWDRPGPPFRPAPPPALGRNGELFPSPVLLMQHSLVYCESRHDE